ncbi:MAG: electron transfer flavoprotein subunit alpha/FixB family protein [Terriglobia bacterium]
MNKDVLVVAEHFRGRLNEITLELLGKGRELAHALGGKLGVILLGQGARNLVPELGAADVVYLADHAPLEEFDPDVYRALILTQVKGSSPGVVLLGSTSVGLDLLGFLSVGGGFSCIDNCMRLGTLDGQVVATSQLYGGKVFAEVALPDVTTLVAVIPGAFSGEAGRIKGNPEVQLLSPPEGVTSRITFRKLIEPPEGDVDITKAPILVAVGRGIQNAANVALVEELAEALGGAVCASRPVIDQGWLPLTRQVGKSGMTVKPKLYLAFGISGAPEHIEGMKNSEMIIAVNTDPNAPIFGVAHFGITEDALELLPLLTEEIRNMNLKKVS